jgi:hypothetical protein
MEEVIQGMAELVYYEKPVKKAAGEAGKGDIIQFKDLPEDKRKGFLTVATKIFENLDKLNYVVVKKGKVDSRDPQMVINQRSNRVLSIINDWIASLERPKKLREMLQGDYVPLDNLAKQIVEFYATGAIVKM